MQRVRLRRFVLLAVLVATAAIGLAGCQTQPGTAGYVGGTRLTDADVEQTVSRIQADVAKAQPGGRLPTGDLRAYVVGHTIFNELAARYATEQGITVPARDYKAAADSIGLPADDPLVRLSADEDAYRTALLARTKPVQPTETEVRGIYDKVSAAVGDLGDYASVRNAIVSLPTLPPALGLRNELADAAKRYGVGVSPRYQPVEVPLLTVGSNPSVDIVTLPLGQASGSPAVHDVT